MKLTSKFVGIAFLSALSLTACNKAVSEQVQPGVAATEEDKATAQAIEVAITDMAHYQDSLAAAHSTQARHHYDKLYHHHDSVFTHHHKAYKHHNNHQDSKGKHPLHHHQDSLHAAHKVHHP